MITFNVYIELLFNLFCCFILPVAPLGISFILSPITINREKQTPYECGFHPFQDSRKEFNVHFYLVALLFIIFDLELIFLLPWVFKDRKSVV